MRLNKPSYGVFMVDIFASSVGIFILISLLYIIESAKATSNEVMAERFKTLVKHDKVPVDRYSLPASRDPLHDWGVRARHARDKEEALILLLKDKILLYHTMQTLDKNDIVDSDAIRQYYDKYNKNHRLILEIHYHDAYHFLKAKIHESLPADVHLWIHWAYNAGNIANPNPILSNVSTDRVNMSNSRTSNQSADPNGMPSSTALSTSTGKGSSDSGNPNGNGSPDGNGEGDGQSDGEGNEQGDGQGSGSGGSSGSSGDNDQGQAQGSADGNADLEPTQDSPLEGAQQNDATAKDSDPLQQAVEQQMQVSTEPDTFIEQMLAPPANEDDVPINKPQDETIETATPDSDKAQPTTKDPFDWLKREQSTEQSDTTSYAKKLDNPAEVSELQQQAEVFIKQNTFVSVPLFSPIGHFQLDIQVPGYEHQRYSLNAVKLNLHLTAQQDQPAIAVELGHGDALIPLASTTAPGWIEVKIVKVSAPDQPLRGWVYGKVVRQILMLPLYQNTLRSVDADPQRYWFKANNQSLEQFNTTPEQESP